MFWQREPCKATWLFAAHRWGQKTRCLLVALGEAVLCQEMGDVVLISPTFSPNRPLPFSRWVFNYWAMRNKEDASQKGWSIGLFLHASSSEDPSGLDSEVRQVGVRIHCRKEKRHADTFRMWRFAARPPLQNPQCQANFNQLMHLES